MTKSRHAANQKRLVWDGRLDKTDSGLKKSDLAVSKSGQIVSKLKQQNGIAAMRKMRANGQAAPPFTSQTAKVAAKRSSSVRK